jgi:hypothetical protein
VKPLEFKLERGPDEEGDETHRAHTPFGSYSVSCTSGRWEWSYCFDEYYDEADAECENLSEGIVAANAHWAERVAPIFPALANPEAEARLRERDEALTVLRDHHRWHTEAGELGLPDGDGGWIAIDLSAEYGDSRLYERTAPLVDLLPPEHRPMPRAGAGSNHWENWVLAVRRLKAAERRAEAAEARLAQAERVPAVTEGRKFSLGDRVTKTKGSRWTGHVVGFYSTELTPVGYAVESETETGSVQIYPEAALQQSAAGEEGK